MPTEAIQERGHCVLPDAFTGAESAAMCDTIWSAIEQAPGPRRNDPATWPESFPATQATGLQHLKSLTVFDPIGGGTTSNALDTVLGTGGWERPRQWGQFLVNFPERVPGRLVNGTWHTDFPYDRGPMPGVVVFSLLADVQPASGGTLVVEGSHRLMERYVESLPAPSRTRFKAIREDFMAENSWFSALASAAETGIEPAAFRERFMDVPTTVDGVSVRVVELSGRAGDIVICHPWQLHAPARNYGAAPRMMRIQRVHRRVTQDREFANLCS